MAGTLLHITLAEKALEAAKLPESIKNEIRGAGHDFRLGAVLVDLPYYNRIVRNFGRTLVGKDLVFGTWGTLLHMRSPARLMLSLLDGADGSAGRAMALGALTHLAVDVVFHSEIRRLVMLEADGTESLEATHKRIEDQIDLHVFYDSLGHSGVGTPYARTTLALQPDKGWAKRARNAILEIHFCAPTASALKSWLMGLALFGLANSSSSFPWVLTLPDDNPELLKLSLDLADQATELCAAYIETGLAYIEGRIDKNAFLSKVKDRSMLTGKEADPPRIPEHG